ncbi:Phage terminase-like protein, large subunit, contains N-terminal HTH domain [Paenibacillus sp. UNCCL117]|uniref:terminase large subunit n=1 Tax=unclassified Paenibacillus TaxID=185978 RepID=UPI00087FF8D9|nr:MULTISPECIES: terminase large subunit [unclassified Paenibacillus]SDD27319.1 Phage terminase-like protein, large subunit, contains N-terminal HTH domain [Paenibacillus sp. cl123]SFW40559.1 Phage terminase-like protein, large subunit, contains N-terminal HTH domain [Paenibacillus sp. UNCCL117]
MTILPLSEPPKLQTTQYACDVINGKVIASKKVKQACQRHLNDLKRQGTNSFPYVFDEEKGYRPVEYIEKFCKPSMGDYDKLVLQPWQHFIVGSLYGWVHKDTGLRRFREGLIFVARKNGKSAIVSGLSLYGASKDGENGARVFQLANSKEQARELFDECKAMIKASPLLRKHFDETLHEIRFRRTMSKIMPLATDSKKLDGKNCSMGAFDEIHEYKTYKLINVIKNSTGARKQPMILYITTAGYQLDGPLMDYYDKAADVLEGVYPADHAFYFIAEIDPEDDVEDPINWPKANPNLGITIKLEDMLKEWEDRKHIPAERNDFVTKRLNRFVQSDEQSFVDFEILRSNDKMIDINTLTGRPCIGSFDLSESEDFTSACLEFPLGDGNVFVLSHSWIPQRKVDLDNEGLPFREWEADGLLTISPGRYVKYELIYEWFVKQAELYAIELIGYDPANAFRLVEDLKAYGFNTLVVRQGPLTLSPALKDAKELLIDGRVIFNQNPLFRWYLNNVKLVEDQKKNWMPTKQGRYRKIDGFAAWLNAHTEVMKKMAIPQATGNVEFISINDLLGR